jgi:hypothetical protein
MGHNYKSFFMRCHFANLTFCQLPFSQVPFCQVPFGQLPFCQVPFCKVTFHQAFKRCVNIYPEWECLKILIQIFFHFLVGKKHRMFKQRVDEMALDKMVFDETASRQKLYAH